MQQWASEARAAAQILKLSQRLYLTTKDYANLSRYSTRVLSDLLERLNGLVDSDPGNAQYLLMRAYVQDELDGKPHTTSPDLVKGAADAVVAKLREELTTEMTKGQALLDRFTRWQLQADEALKKAVAEVGASI